MKLRFLRPTGGFKAGDVIDAGPRQAQALLSQGVVVDVRNDPPAAPGKKKTRKKTKQVGTAQEKPAVELETKADDWSDDEDPIIGTIEGG